MVKRVQQKIDQDRPTEQPADADFTVPTPSPEDTSPNVTAAKDAGELEPMRPDTLEKVNVDHIDRRRFLSALQRDLFGDNPPRPPSEVASVTVGEETSPNIEPPQPKAPDTQEEILSVEEQSVIADAIEDKASTSDETIPPTAVPKKTSGADCG